MSLGWGWVRRESSGAGTWESHVGGRAVALSLSPFVRGCPLALPGGAQAVCRVWLEVLREEGWLWEGTGCQAVPNAASWAVASMGHTL